jgi:hypothetical protein
MDDSADQTVPRGFTAAKTPSALESAIPRSALGRVAAGTTRQTFAPRAASRLANNEKPPVGTQTTTTTTTTRASARTNSPPHHTTIDLAEPTTVVGPPPVVVPRRTSSRRTTKKTQRDTPSTFRPSEPVQEQTKQQQQQLPTIRTLMTNMTTGEDDDDEDSSEELYNSGDEQWRTRMPLSARLDELVTATSATTTTTTATSTTSKRPINADDNDDDGDDAAAPITQPAKKAFLTVDDFTPSTTLSGARRIQETDTIKVLPDRFEQFQTDSTNEFLAGNKPPWAPSLAARPLNNARRWKTMELYDHYDLSLKPWYRFLELVCGYAGVVDISEFARTESYGERTGLLAPNRVGDRPALLLGGAAAPGGVTDAAVAGMLSPAGQVRGDGAPSQLFAPRGGGGRGRTLFSGGVPQTPRRDDGPGGFPQDFDEIMRTMTSTARYSAEREQIAKDLHTDEIIDEDTPADREARRKERLDMVRALPYIIRPLATGVFLLNPTYVAALSSAYAKVQIYGGPDTTLRNVPKTEFMRERTKQETGGDSASESVRQTFAELVACQYFLTRDSIHRGNRFQIDRQANIERANELLKLFRYRFGYDRRRKVFYDVTPSNDERYTPEQSRYSNRFPTNGFNTVYNSLSGPAYFRPF